MTGGKAGAVDKVRQMLPILFAATLLGAPALAQESDRPGRERADEIVTEPLRDYRNAIQAGVIRRGYLKGLGAARGRRPPAAPRR